MNLPPGAQGKSWWRWFDEQIAGWRKEMESMRDPDEEPWINGQRIITPRDSYGWRSLPSGPRMLKTARRQSAPVDG